MSIKSSLDKSLNEKDVENIYRSELVKMEGTTITSPFGVDGLIAGKHIRTLLEFKFKENLKSRLSQVNILIQCLYYIKKFENAGDKLPSTIFVGDSNECFVLHTNAIIKYLSRDIDWKLAPSEAYRYNHALLSEMMEDQDISPFVFDVDSEFDLVVLIEKIKDFSKNVTRKVRITNHNVVTIFDYFDKNILSKVSLTTNEKANLFIQLIINPGENFIHPKRRNILVTKSFGEVNVNGSMFTSFFSHFEGDLYSPKEKEILTTLVDRLVEDSIRRRKGEFFTPTPFVDLAHKYITDAFGEDWKERFVVWDCAWGTGNLTRDYKFKELYCSTLEQSDIDTAEQMGYNQEATKFQFDFLNDSDDNLPPPLQEAINGGKEILFLINPPYAAATNFSKEIGDHKSGVSRTEVGRQMEDDNYKKPSQNLYAQFIYKIVKLTKINKNIKLAIFCPPLFLSGGSYKSFRQLLFESFGFTSGFMFEASNFADVSSGWGIGFTIFDGVGCNRCSVFDTVEIDEDFLLKVVGTKTVYNTDESIAASDWLRTEIRSKKTFDCPQLSSSVVVKQSGRGNITRDALGYFVNSGNNVMFNQTNVLLMTSAFSNGNGVPILPENINKVVSLFTARKCIYGNWINDKDEYIAPNTTHPDYGQFVNDSLVYSLFNNSSQQSSLRNITYKNKLWDIKNEFFWMSKENILALAEVNHYDDVYKDARTSDNRFVYNKLFEEGLYYNLSADAKDVLDTAAELLINSFSTRKIVSDNHPEYHLNAWDAGYAQLKLVWKEYHKEEFNEFRKKYKLLEDRMCPLVYELGFLLK